MGRILAGLLVIAHAALVLAFAYVVGALLGVAVGFREIGRALGLVVGVLALIAYYRQPPPGRRRRYIAAIGSFGELIPHSPYGDEPATLVVGAFLLICVCACLGGTLLWLFK